MKTSKIIFISLLSTIALIILAAMVDFRMSGRRDGNSADFKTKKVILPAFSVIYMNNSNNVQLVQNDSSYMEVTYLKDSIAPDVKYTVKSDTLVISDLKLLNKSNVSVVVNTTDSLRVMQLKNSNCGINNFNFKNLFFDLDQSSLWLKQSGKEKTPVRVVSMLVKNHSHVNCNDFQIDSMGIVFQNSQADFGISINKISGSLSDSSRVYIQHFDEIALKKDASSAINVND